MSNRAAQVFALIDPSQNPTYDASSLGEALDCCNLKVDWRECDPGTVFDYDSGDCVPDCKNDYGKTDEKIMEVIILYEIF